MSPRKEQVLGFIFATLTLEWATSIVPFFNLAIDLAIPNPAPLRTTPPVETPFILPWR